VKALVLGAEGQLGSEIVKLLGSDSGVARHQVSITDSAALDALLAARQPAVVFNCAAYNAVDRAESEPKLAFDVNASGSFNVATACARHGARFVHFSTNFVFDGTKDSDYVETDGPSPLGVYGHSKLEGERRVAEALPTALVIRTAAVFGGNRGQSFPERILARAAEGLPLRVVADQRVNPTYTKDLAVAAVGLAEQGMEGLVHLASGDCCRWDVFATTVLAEFELAVGVEPISSADLSLAAQRPRNGCLASIKVRSLRPWREALHDWAVGRRTGPAR
jgi:dTDP-4-dehydrorhamnose reductase